MKGGMDEGGTLKFEFLEDVAEIEVGRRLADKNYGDFRLLIRVSTKASEINPVVDGLKEYIDDKLGIWFDEYEEKMGHKFGIRR